MNRFIGSIIAIALVVIAANATYTNMHKPPEKDSALMQERVLPVVGRVTLPFDGIGATLGFLVKDGDDLKILHYDAGSMAANEGFRPKYVNFVKFSNGQTAWNPVTLEQFD